VPQPASRRSSLARLLVATLLAAAVGSTMPAALLSGVAAAELTDSPDRLDHPILDLALLAPDGPDDAPRLLVIDATAPQAGTVRLAILQRDGPWSVVSDLALELDARATDALGTPWLIGLGPDRFALLSVATATDRTIVIGLRTDGGPGRNEVVESGRVTVGLAIDDAGAADVDGDGAVELALGSARTVRAGGTCQGSTVTILDGVTLAPLATIDIAGRRLAGGVLGRWDGLPGDDLLAYAYPNCPAGPDTANEVHLMAIRLRDGAVIRDEPGIAADGLGFLGLPVRADIDGTGTHEVVAMSAEGLAIVDPARDWQALPLGTTTAFPVLAVDDRDATGPGARVAFVDVGGPDGPSTARIVRSVEGFVDIQGAQAYRPEEVVPARAEDVFIENMGAIQRQASPVGWLGPTTDDACPDLFLTGSILPCGEGELRAGPAWIGTRPVAVVVDDGRRRLVVAAGLAQDPSTGYPRTPTPWATAGAGWWRHGPSGPFALAELRAGDATYYREFPVPRVTIERTTAPDATTDIPGFTGVRLFVRIEALTPDAGEPIGNPSRGEVLSPAPPGSRPTLVTRIAVPPGVEAGRDGGFATIPLADATLPDGSPADRWSVAVVPVNDWGEMGAPVAAAVVRDAIGPSLVVEAPFTSPIWPFPASLGGSAEPRSVVRVDGLGTMELDRRGRFSIQMALAPWPQTLRITATDASGNVTRRDVSVVGGVDYRRFPWGTIAAGALLLAVGASGLFGSRRRRGDHAPAAGRPLTIYAADDGPMAEVEDLPPGGGLA